MARRTGQQHYLPWLGVASVLLVIALFAPQYLPSFLIGGVSTAIALSALWPSATASQDWHWQYGPVAVGTLIALGSGLAWRQSPLLTMICLLTLVALITIDYQRTMREENKPAGFLLGASFTERAEEELSRGVRFGRTATAVVLEVTPYLAVRQAYGRRAAEIAVNRIVEVLQNQLRNYDLCTRLAPNQFALLLPETAYEEAVLVLERIQLAVTQIQFAPPSADRTIPLSVGLGIASHPPEGHSIQVLLAQATKQLGSHQAVHTLPPAPLARPVITIATMPLPQWYQIAYIGMVWTVCLGVFWWSFTPIPRSQWLTFLTLGIIAIASRQMRLDLQGRGSVANHFAALLAAGLILGPSAAMILGVASAIMVWPWSYQPRKYIFDAASFALSAGGAIICHRILLPFLPIDGLFHWTILLHGFILGTLCYLINVVVLIGIVACAEGTNTLGQWRERYGWFFPYTIVFGILAICIYESEQALGILGMIIFAVPIFMMHLATKQYVDHTKEYVIALREAHTRLEETNTELRESVAALESSYAATLSAFSGMLDARDSETQGHSQRVVAYAMALGRAVNLADHELASLEVGAMLHDIGKVGVPDAILRKKGPLTPEEWQEMRQHPEVGYQLTSRIPFLDSASPVVRHHHERWDGTGYPDRLQAEAIPLAARIFTVADSFDAMISDRPYRRGLSIEQALAELQRGAGTQFDPQIIAIFSELITTPGWLERVTQQATSLQVLESQPGPIAQLLHNERTSTAPPPF